MVITLAQELESSYVRIRQQNSSWELNDASQLKYFEWIRLKKLCETFGLEESYQIYWRRVCRNYLKSFMRIHFCVGTIHGIAVLLGSNASDYYFYDSIIYFAGAVLVCLSLTPYLTPVLVRKYPSTPHVVAWISCLIMAVTDCLPSLIGYTINKDILTYCYGGYTISTIYLFMPITSIVHLAPLAASVSALYCWNSVNSSYEQFIGDKIVFELRFFIPELVFLVGINLVGIFFRIRHDFRKRKIFLTKSLNIEENLLLKYAKDHEHNLLLTIIPAQIAKKIEEDIKIRIERSKYLRFFKGPTIFESGRKLFIEPHYNVSILFADVVNYTYLTTTLDVKALVETLHELFQRFDSACEEFNCMRIKFLGDCYYCVAGVPQTHPYHALCCVELGRAIINHINEVRTMRSLDIDMRIGIHSGNILSGIIGAAKWQYDIWSKDVDIASRLEQTGMAGQVHVSEATLHLIEGYYEYEDGTEEAKSDPLLQKERILTYLITNPSDFMTTSGAWNNFKRQYKKSRILKLDSMDMGLSPSPSMTKIKKTTKLDYADIRSKANAEITKKVRTLPVCKLSINEQCFTRLPRLAAHEMEDYKANRNISVCCLWFEDWNWETLFNRERDEYFKMSVLGAVLTMWCIMGIQASNKTISITFEYVLTFILLYSILMFYSTIILVTTWFQTIWNKIQSQPYSRPHNKFARLLYRISKSLERNWQYRAIVYISLVLSVLLAAFVHLMSCDQKVLENDDDLIHEFISGGTRVLCFNSWAVTNSISLCLALIMTFSYIPYCLSLTVGIFVFIYYVVVIFVEFSIVYEASIITNRSIRAEYSHIWSVLTVFIIYQLMNRHVVYLGRIEAYTKWNVDKKREDAHITNESIKILLHNILPSHVVNIYLSKRLRNEPYYEQHEFVAVMFATIIYARSGSIELRLLNEIICDFDEVLNYYKGSIRVEKIKVANWSYMAACGFNIFSLQTRRYSQGISTAEYRAPSTSIDMVESMYNVYKRHSSQTDALTNESDSSFSKEEYEETEQNIHEYDSKDHEPGNDWKEQQMKKVLNVMAHFALDLLRSMESFNASNQLARGSDEPPIMLRIGISCGEVMAGVVGSSQAHYDIWGNAVNMASRMDSTGEPGHIQVTDETAEMLTSLNIACTYRGMTFVKGRGDIPTFFVEISKDMIFKEVSKNNSFATFRSWFK